MAADEVEEVFRCYKRVVIDTLERSIDASLPGVGHISYNSRATADSPYGELALRVGHGKRHRMCRQLQRLRRITRHVRRGLRADGHSWAIINTYN